MQIVDLILPHIVTGEMWISLVAATAIIALAATHGKDHAMDVDQDELRRAQRQKKGGYVWGDKLDQMWRRSDEIHSVALDAMSEDGVPDAVRKQLRRIIELERTQTNDIVLLRNMRED